MFADVMTIKGECNFQNFLLQTYNVPCRPGSSCTLSGHAASIVHTGGPVAAYNVWVDRVLSGPGTVTETCSHDFKFQCINFISRNHTCDTREINFTGFGTSESHNVCMWV